MLMHYPPAEGYQSSEMLLCFGWGGSFLDSADVFGGSASLDHYWKTGYGNRLEKTLGTGFPTGSRQPRPMASSLDTGYLTRCLRHPLVPVRKSNRYQRGCHTDAKCQPLWYRLVFPTGTNDLFSFFFQIQFCLLYLLLFILL